MIFLWIVTFSTAIATIGFLIDRLDAGLKLKKCEQKYLEIHINDENKLNSEMKEYRELLRLSQNGLRISVTLFVISLVLVALIILYQHG